VQFGKGTLIASPDGQYLALRSASTLRLFSLPNGGQTALFSPTALANISTRAVVQTGDAVTIAGFTVTGSSPMETVVRVIGPSLARYGVPNTLANPTMQLYDATGKLMVANDDWQEGPDSLNTFDVYNTYGPADTRESAIDADLDPGEFTVVVRGKNQTTGTALVEVYAIDAPPDVKLTNISTRGNVGSGDEVMIAGFIISSATNLGNPVVVRALGPSLARSGLSNVLQDPTIELYDANGSRLVANDNWRDTQALELTASGFSPPDERDAAMLVNLGPGSYTAIVHGKNTATGIALVEVYNLD